DPKWVQKVQDGKLLFRNIVGNVRMLAEEIKKALDYYTTSFKDEFEEADQELRTHQETMKESRLRNDAIAKQEYTRAMRLIQLCATLAMIRKELGVRLTEIQDQLVNGADPELTEEQRRLENVSPILVNTFGSLLPFIPTTTNNGIMFTHQRNDNALQEFRLYLFRQIGIAQWKANMLIQLNAASSTAADLALSIAEKQMNEEGLKATAAYKQQMVDVARRLQDFMLEMETFQAQVNAITEAGTILSDGLKAADQKAHQVSKTIEAGRSKVEKAHEDWSRQLQSIMAS
ncbi:hypothetical protein HGB07_09565, partial [Candidatus Roizmanbacteria bacterium]|nr:hypothetical protein [Candidatus Roizmanbacteria bacterium]